MVKRPAPLAVAVLLVIDSTLAVVVGLISGVLAFLVDIFSYHGSLPVIMALRRVPRDQVLLFKWMLAATCRSLH